MPNFLHIFKFLSLIILSLAGCNSAKSQKKNATFTVEKPNVIIIYADQLRLYSAGFWSEPAYREDVIGKPDPVVTPTIYKLAKNGVVLTRAVVNYPLCTLPAECCFRGFTRSKVGSGTTVV